MKYLAISIGLFFLLSCSQESQKSFEESQSVNQSDSKSDILPNGAYSGAMDSKVPVAEFLIGEGEDNPFGLANTPIKTTAISFLMTDTVVLFQPFVEHHGTYGVFSYEPHQNEEGLQLKFRDTNAIRPDDSFMIFHDEYFSKDLEFIVEKRENGAKLFNKDLDLRLSYLEYETKILDSILTTADSVIVEPAFE